MEETPTPRALEPPQPAAERTAGGGAGAAGPGAHGVTPEAPELWRPGPGQRTPHPAGVGEAARALGTTLGAPGPGTSLGLIYLRLPRLQTRRDKCLVPSVTLPRVFQVGLLQPQAHEATGQPDTSARKTAGAQTHPL
ncbi:uncharacterized protein LOC121491912 isoform X1 [Vulpes lagopus]|uniref:uncharacterized protein LOC121491912 isoform X1 n=1 Tax=Vulpes lagopus TaxID=494514 RepID=UPI001BCA66C2|nr:uncharacterized protein LOC121491912 isoform X1 [Vulpes lagopus]